MSQVNNTADDQYFFLKQEAKEEIPRLFYRKDFHCKDELLFSSLDFRKDSDKKYVINFIKPSWDGTYVVVSLSHSGQEISEMIVIDMATRKVLPFVIDHCAPTFDGGIQWLPDNSGFIYIHHPEIDPNSEQFLKELKAVVYKLGADPTDLKIIFSRDTHPYLGLAPTACPVVYLLAKNDQYLYGVDGQATAHLNTFYAPISDLEKDKINWKPLFRKEDKVEEVVFDGDQVIYTSMKHVSNGQILSTSIENANLQHPTVLVNASEDEVISQLALTDEALYFTSSKNGVEAKLYKFQDGKTSFIPLPVPSGASLIASKGRDCPSLWVATRGWLNNVIRYKYQHNQFKEVTLTAQGDFPEFRNFVVKELLVSSHDGVLVPLSIIHQKGIELKGQHPTLIQAYGSYGVSIHPYFSAEELIWVEEGGIYCVAHVRGGGEKGDQWYQAGKKANKSNSWKDLIACTEYMIKEGYTTTDKTAIWGRSAGGILVGRAMTDRPDLFAVAISVVGVMNTLRIEETANGVYNIKEFGTNKDDLECKALIEMDAYLNLQKGVKYPATLLTAGMHDQRVLAWVPGKFTAKIQQYTGSDKPILFHVDDGAGHGGDGTRSKYFQELANIFGFAFWQMGQKGYELEII